MFKKNQSNGIVAKLFQVSQQGFVEVMIHTLNRPDCCLPGVLNQSIRRRKTRDLLRFEMLGCNMYIKSLLHTVNPQSKEEDVYFAPILSFFLFGITIVSV